MTISLADAVLLPIDFQKVFDLDGWPRRWNHAVDERGLKLIETFRRAGRPIIHVRHDSVEPGSRMARGMEGNEYREGFGPAAGEAEVAKSVNSAFIGTDLDLQLRRLDAKNVIVCGFSTDMCVSTTIRTGVNMGWRMLLVEDACDCFDLPDGKGGSISAEAIHAAHVASLAFDFCKVVGYQEIVGK